MHQIYFNKRLITLPRDLEKPPKKMRKISTLLEFNIVKSKINT